MRRAIAFGPVLLALLLLTSGCWDYRETDQLAIVYALGLDRVPGSESILLTVQVITPAAGKRSGASAAAGAESKSFTTLSGTGKSVFDAISRLGRKLPRRLYFAHTKIVIFGKTLAEAGLGDVLDALNRNPEIRSTTLMFATDGSAKRILTQSTPLERLPAKGLEMIAEKSKRNAFVPEVNLNSLNCRFDGVPGAAFLPLVQLVKDPGSPSGSGTGENLMISRTGIFAGERLVGILTRDESKGLMWLINRPQGQNVTLDGAGGTGVSALRILAGQTNIVPQVSESGITMEIQCSARANVRETETVGIDLNDPASLQKLEHEAEQVIKRQVEETVTDAESGLGADFVGFGRHVRAEYPAEWKRVEADWDDVFPSVRFEVVCRIKIVNTGVINNPSRSGAGKE
ncbi:germination protein, Ger(x)C family [Acididesulfobacillus acetoxydans]|uniref:Germination protein, Ger(X)C family n=1 Tax=Acididesulfobacillus acetoxydans TaxID=1561005 RepID=A0A8S0W455_9FIRM|nr:Ger(x)C family spore germination protein [Acididesulfobacillus acetoxydans]CAA7602248.1 germination protein, Ger(x)C family [Acididesulfobacillus acetoxydans]CEJ07534.1 Germination, Ger(X)C protein [Acididesulfobacillus acetoxydans]